MNGIQSAESLSLDTEVKSGSLSFPTTSHEEMVSGISVILFTVWNV